jgi:glyoxylase-like metal-dependent hydrolase (beta-lactamase superfamily II)
MTATHVRVEDLVVEHIAPSVVRIELPLPFEDLHVVNAYAVLGDGAVTLIDPGWSNPETEAVLLNALDGLGAGRGDVRRTLATHSHPDHYTLAVQWQREHDIPVLLGLGEKPTVDAWDTLPGRFPRQADRLLRAGAPDLAETIRALPLEPFEAVMAFGPPAEWLADDQVLDCEGIDIAVRATPGHTRGHVVFEHLDEGLTFTGDHILPRITPSTGHEMEPEPHPLRSYLSSLQLFLHRPDTVMLPAHGAVTSSAAERATELLAHHADRFEQILERVAAGDSTAWEIAWNLTWTRRGLPLSALNEVHTMTAVLEVLAHLDVLTLNGRAESTTAQGVDNFELGDRR